MFKFYHAIDNPTGLTGQVGGAIDTGNPLSGYLHELFPHIAAPPTGTATGTIQYRKVWFRNEYPTSSTSTKLWIDGVEHSGQIQLASETVDDQTATNPTGSPTFSTNEVTGWKTPENYLSGMEFGDITSGSSSGFWIRQTLSGIQIEDPYAVFTLHVAGLIS